MLFANLMFGNVSATHFSFFLISGSEYSPGPA